MKNDINLTIDGAAVKGRAGDTIMQAADRAGLYIPRLCAHKELEPFGACRVCTVLVNGRPQAACTTPAAEGMVIENDTPALRDHRRSLVEMLFVEGNHYCMFCEKSGNCELQALGYRLGMDHPRHAYQFPVDRDVDASHPDVMIDRNRCVQCGRCVRASRDVDGKHVFQFVGRGARKKIWIDADTNLAGTKVAAADKGVEVCPVGCLIRKRTGYRLPIGERLYDHKPIGSDIEAKSGAACQHA